MAALDAQPSSSSSAVPTTGGHINLFEDLEHVLCFHIAVPRIVKLIHLRRTQYQLPSTRRERRMSLSRQRKASLSPPLRRI